MTNPTKQQVLDFTHEDATHRLECQHCIGCHCKSYTMKCIVLKDMGDGRVKVLVFGDRYWKDRLHIKRIRYVKKHRIVA